MTLKELLNKGGKWLPTIGLGIAVQSSSITNLDHRARIKKELEMLLEKEAQIKAKYNDVIATQDIQNKLEASTCRVVEYFEEIKRQSLSIDSSLLNSSNTTPDEQSTLIKNVQHLVENQKVTINSLSDELDAILEVIKDIKPKGSDVFGVFKDMLNSYQEFLLTLNLEQKIALSNLCSDIFIFACLVTIASIFYGDLIIKYFNLEERFPKIAKLIQLRRKVQTYSLSLNIALIFVMLIFIMLYNLYFIFFLYK